MDLEELEAPVEPEPARGLRPITWAVIALVGLAVGSFVVSQNHVVSSTELSEQQPDQLQPAPVPIPTAGLVLGLGQNVILGVACPSRVVAPGTLAASFELTNWGPETVVVTAVTVRSKHGLRPRGPSSAGGTCEQPSQTEGGSVITSGETQLFTLWFEAPKGCPSSSKVIALDLRAAQLVGTTTVAVKRDVGQLLVNTCPS